MRKLLTVFVVFLMFSSDALAAPKIDRSKSILYPISGASLMNTVFVSIESGYAYHHSKRCTTETKILRLSKEDFTEITEYEALLRGYFECPDCSDDLKYYDVDEIDSISSTVDDIESDLNDLIDFLIRLFTKN